MCGVFLTTNLSTSDALIFDMVRARGQDVQGVKTFRELKVAFGRLGYSRDFDVINQPYYLDSQGAYFWFTGEIYNYRELGRRLKLNEPTEIEVIAHLYEKFGDDSFSHLRGMFSIYIYSPEQKTVTRVRDQFGTNPLYYFYDGKHIEVGSDLKYFKLNNDLMANSTAWCDYFVSNSYYCSRDTFFQNCYEVEPGSRVTLSLDQPAVKDISSWYDENDIMQETVSVPQQVEKLCAQIREYFFNNLSAMSQSPFQYAAFCSGGVDSTLISNSLIRLGIPAKYFWHFTTGAEHDFSSVAWDVLEEKHRERLKISSLGFDEMFSKLTQCVSELSAPVAGLNTVALKVAFENMKDQGVKYVFSGEGADEIFGGYQHHAQAFKTGQANRSNVIQSFGEYRFETILSEDVRLSHKEDMDHRAVTRSQNFSASQCSRLGDLYGSKLRRSLTQGNLLALNSGIEVRYPFLDERIIRTCFNIDDEIIFNGGETSINKLFLINIFSDLSVPKSPKQVVQTNQTDWVMGYREWIIDTLQSSTFNDLGIVDRKKAINYVENFCLAESRVGYPLWQILNFAVANSR